MDATLSRRAFVGTSALGLLGCRAVPAAEPRPRPVAVAPRPRTVALVVPSVPVTDGAGVHLRRALGQPALGMLDPFLMLDQFGSNDPADYLAGFPWHPHRGFETVTYMIEGAMEHEDSLGNRGRLGSGAAQWMTAGHGIVHQEMPRQSSGVMRGFQLWVNLPRSHKMIPPRYQDIAGERIPTVRDDGVAVRVVAGEVHGARGPVDGIVTEPRMCDVLLAPGKRFELPLPPGHNAFLYAFEGRLRAGASETDVAAGSLATFAQDGDHVRVASADGGRFILFAGRPIGEPVARRGPFVMNTDEEIRQAYLDYQTGRLTQL